jgi:hypothetical protein
MEPRPKKILRLTKLLERDRKVRNNEYCPETNWKMSPREIEEAMWQLNLRRAKKALDWLDAHELAKAQGG